MCVGAAKFHRTDFSAIELLPAAPDLTMSTTPIAWSARQPREFDEKRQAIFDSMSAGSAIARQPAVSQHGRAPMALTRQKSAIQCGTAIATHHRGPGAGSLVPAAWCRQHRRQVPSAKCRAPGAERQAPRLV